MRNVCVWILFNNALYRGVHRTLWVKHTEYDVELLNCATDFIIAFPARSPSRNNMSLNRKWLRFNSIPKFRLVAAAEEVKTVSDMNIKCWQREVSVHSKYLKC